MRHLKSKLWVGALLGLAAGFGCKADDSNGGGNFGAFAGTNATAGSGGAGVIGNGTGGLSGASGAAPQASTGGMTAAAAGHGGASGAAPGAGRGGAAAVAGAGGTNNVSVGGGMAPPGGTGDGSMCPAAPDGASDTAIRALKAVNAARVPAGSGCIKEVAALNMSALNHCNYYAMYSMGDMCIADPHGEVMGCAGYTGASLGQRGVAVGYPNVSSEVMAFVDNPESAVAQWINTVWHRIPILDPWTGEMGYGGATKCDTIDFGRGTAPSEKDAVVVYPYDGQTNLPTLFNGKNEGPMPPAPTTGWPSSTPINVYAQGIAVSEHTLTVDGDSTPIDHVFLDANTQGIDPKLAQGFLRSTVFMYANKPFTPNTKYRVKVVGTHTGGPINLEWTFTTGAGNRF